MKLDTGLYFTHLQWQLSFLLVSRFLTMQRRSWKVNGC